MANGDLPPSVDDAVAALDALERQLFEAGPAFEGLTLSAREAASSLGDVAGAAPPAPPPLAPPGYPGPEPPPPGGPYDLLPPGEALTPPPLAPLLPLELATGGQAQAPGGLPVPAPTAASSPAQVLPALATTATNLRVAMEPLTGKFRELAGAAPALPASVGAAGGAGAAGTRGAADALGGLTGAVSGATMAFGLTAAAVYKFVDAFSPAIVQQFQQALNDLSAVVGEALAPVMQGLTTLAREVGSILQPVMRELQPVFQSLVQTVLAVLLPTLDTWGSVLQSLTPVIVFLAEVLANVGTIARVSGAFLAGVIEQLRQWAAALGGWMGGLTGVANPAESFTTWLKNALQSVGEAAILAAGYLAKLVGATGFLEGMIKSLQPKPELAKKEDITGKGAAQQARVTTATDFEKSALSAAFIATGGVPEKKSTEEWLANVVKELEKIQAGQDNKVDQFIRMILDANKWLEKIASLLGTSKEVVAEGAAVGGAALPYAIHPVGFAPAGTAIGAFLGGLFGGGGNGGR